MSDYLIVAIRVDRARERIVEVRWGEVDHSGSHFVAGTTTAEVLEVVDAIYAGNNVYAHRTVEGRIMPGARIRTMIFDGGEEGIAIEDADVEAGHSWGLVDLF